MIVDSMTYEEIIDLFKVDCAILLHKINENNKRFHKAVRESRTKGKRYFKPITFSGSRGFNYVLQFFDYGIDFPTKKRLGLYYYAWFRKNVLVYITMLGSGKTEVYMPCRLQNLEEAFGISLYTILISLTDTGTDFSKTRICLNQK